MEPNKGYAEIDYKTWDHFCKLNGDLPADFVAISYIGWHADPDFDQQYGTIGLHNDIDQRVTRFLDAKFPHAHGIEPVTCFWTTEAFRNGGGGGDYYMIALGKTYSLAQHTYAVLDARDALFLRQFSSVAIAAGNYLNSKDDSTREAFVKAVEDARQKNFWIHPLHSFWTRGWLAQEQLYSPNLTYVYEYDQDGKTELAELSRGQCQSYCETLRCIQPEFSSNAVVAEWLGKLDNISYSLVLGPNPESAADENNPLWASYLKAARLLPKQARDSMTLLNIMLYIFYNLPGGENWGPEVNRKDGFRTLRPIALDLYARGYIPLPLLYTTEGFPSWCYHTFLGAEDARGEQKCPTAFLTTDTFFALGNVAHGVELYTDSGAMTLRVDLGKKVEIQSPAPGSYLVPIEDPETYEQRNIMRTGFVMASQPQYPRTITALAVSETHAWLLEFVGGKIIGYVDYKTLKETQGITWEDVKADFVGCIA